MYTLRIEAGGKVLATVDARYSGMLFDVGDAARAAGFAGVGIDDSVTVELEEHLFETRAAVTLYNLEEYAPRCYRRDDSSMIEAIAIRTDDYRR